MRPTIAVCIPYHNEGALLTECLASLCAREAPDELWIYDDVSTLRPDAYIPSGVQARVIRGEKNVGPGPGRNRLWRESRADYVHFHDSDDTFDPEWLPKVRAALAAKPVDVLFTEVATVFEGRCQDSQLLRLDTLEASGDLLRYCLRGPVLAPAGTYRRDVLAAIGGYREALWQSEDFDFHVRLALRRPTYATLREPLVRQRLHGGSRSGRQVEVWEGRLQAVELLAPEVPREYQNELAEIAATAGVRFWQLGEPVKARQAFATARRFGRPTFRRQWWLYRLIARTLGPISAEQLSSAYRRLLPQGWRQRLRRWPVLFGAKPPHEGYF